MHGFMSLMILYKLSSGEYCYFVDGGRVECVVMDCVGSELWDICWKIS